MCMQEILSSYSHETKKIGGWMLEYTFPSFLKKHRAEMRLPFEWFTEDVTLERHPSSMENLEKS